MERSLKLDIRVQNTTFCCLSTVVGLGILVGVLGGCSSQKISGNQHENTTEIQIGDFRGDPDAPAAVVVDEPAVQESAPVGDGPSSPVLVAGSTTRSGNDAQHRAIRSGNDGLEFLDAKIGDISGHPIYVTSFFEPIVDRLIALKAQQPDLNRWRRDAAEIINARLNGIIYDELLRAETIAALTPQQRVGLQSFLQDFRSNILSENLGSAQLADRRIQEEQGVTLDEALRQKELDTLVGLTLYQEINRGINISWRDIKQRYERDIDRFQPAPTVTLQAIRMREPEGEQVESVTARLNAGEAFADIAASEVNTFFTDTEGKIVTLLEDDFDKTSFFQFEALNEMAWGLSEGEWAGPLAQSNGNYWWVFYAEHSQASESLYDAQIQLLRELTQERRESERERYLTELIERARVSSSEEILLRLLYIAEKQYGPLG